MKKEVTLSEALEQFEALLAGVVDGDEVVIRDGDQVLGALVPPERYEALERSRDRFFAIVDSLHELNKDVPSEVLEREIEEAVREVREARRAS